MNSTFKPAHVGNTRPLSTSIFSNQSYQIDGPNHNCGFSILNFMVTAAITVILASAAIPSFASLLSKSVVLDSTSNLQHSLTMARQYAVVHRRIVHICRMAEDHQKRCHQQRDFNESWSKGWIVFSDTNNNNELDSEDRIIDISQNNTKSGVVFNQRGRLRFFPDGSARSAGFYVCGRDQKHYRHVVLLHTGRTRVSDSLNRRQQGICNDSQL